MSKSLYITSLEEQSGKAVVALALMEQLSGRLGSVSLFRPVVSESGRSDKLITLMMDLYGLRISPEEMYGVTMAEGRPLLAAGKYDELYSRILERYKSLESKSEFVVCVGTDYSGVSTALEFDFNVEVARNIGSPLVPIINGRGKDRDTLINAVRALTESLEEKKCDLLAVVVNRIEPGQKEALLTGMKQAFPTKPVYAFPEEPLLGNDFQRACQRLPPQRLNGGICEGYPKPCGRRTAPFQATGNVERRTNEDIHAEEAPIGQTQEICRSEEAHRPVRLRPRSVHRNARCAVRTPPPLR